MNASTPVAENDPRMIAWKAYVETAEYANTFKWAGTTEQNRQGSLWAAFIEGFTRSASPVVREVMSERARQDAKWGGTWHDDTHSLLDWWAFIRQRMTGRSYPEGPQRERQDLIEIAALAIAAVESMDRKNGRPS